MLITLPGIFCGISILLLIINIVQPVKLIEFEKTYSIQYITSNNGFSHKDVMQKFTCRKPIWVLTFSSNLLQPNKLKGQTRIHTA